jgi:hypothetical protein
MVRLFWYVQLVVAITALVFFCSPCLGDDALPSARQAAEEYKQAEKDVLETLNWLYRDLKIRFGQASEHDQDFLVDAARLIRSGKIEDIGTISLCQIFEYVPIDLRATIRVELKKRGEDKSIKVGDPEWILDMMRSRALYAKQRMELSGARSR